MPIIDLQRRMHEAGRLRIGKSVPATKRDGSPTIRPVKLDTFRLTSRDEQLISQAAQAYGGHPQQWEDQWEVYTEAKSIPVVVPPTDQALSQWYELWSGGGCQRRCDGNREVISDRPCICGPDPQDRACKPTTRLSLLLPDVSGVGLWRLETHGYYAAVELGGVVDVITSAAGRGIMLPARLRLEQRTVVRNDQTNKFSVPVLDIDAPLGQIAAAAGVRAAVGQGAEPTEVGTPATSAALPSGLKPVPESAPTEPTTTVAEQVANVRAKADQGPKRTARSAAPVARTGIAPRTAAQAKAGEPPPKVDEQVATDNQRKAMVIACKQAGLDDDGRHLLVAIATGGVTESTKDVPRPLVDQVTTAAHLIAAGHAVLDVEDRRLKKPGNGHTINFPLDVQRTRQWMAKAGAA